MSWNHKPASFSIRPRTLMMTDQTNQNGGCGTTWFRNILWTLVTVHCPFA